MTYQLIITIFILFSSCFSIQNRTSGSEGNTEPPIIVIEDGTNSSEDSEINEELDETEKYILSRINQLRAKGCRCGNKYYPSTHSLVWNDILYQSAYSHAKSMHDNNFFSHYSLDGKDIGSRLDDIGYKWQYAGENLAEGQKNFDEAMHDWIASPTHCKMLMNKDMKEVAVAKFGSYWVQHFGTQMPKNSKRINRRYTEGQ